MKPLPVPNWLLQESVLAHLIGAGTAATVGTAYVLVPTLRALGITEWPEVVQDITVTLLGVTLVYGPVIAVLGLALLLHVRLTSD
jgi:hypothetical protein